MNSYQQQRLSLKGVTLEESLQAANITGPSERLIDGEALGTGGAP